MNNLILAVSLVLILGFALGWQNKAEKTELEKFRAQAKVEKQNKELARSLFSAIDANDFDKLRSIMASDVRLSHPLLPTPLGLEKAFQIIKNHYAAFPDWKHAVEMLIAEGDLVSVKLFQEGTHKGIYEGIQPTDIKVAMPAQVILVISDGKVEKFWAVEDYLNFYQKLGMELKPKEAKK